MKTKVCSKCKVEKSFDEFGNRKSSNDGKNGRCKSCIKTYNTKWRSENKEKCYNYGKKYREYNVKRLPGIKHKYYIDNKEYCNKCSNKWYLDNNEHARKCSKEHCINNREYYYEYNKQYRKDNSEQVKVYGYKSRAKRRNWGTPIILNEFFENSHCHHLHTINSKTGEVDHRVCLYVPIELHTSIWHSNKNRETMLAINELVFEWLYTQV